MFCIKTDCPIRHNGDGKYTVLPGEGFVLKSRDSVFTASVINTDLLELKLIQVWMKFLLSLDEWSELFLLASGKKYETGVDI